MVIDAWPTLSATAKGHVLAMVQMPAEDVETLDGLLDDFFRRQGLL